MSQVRDVALSAAQLTMSSREIAELCDKDHFNVMRDIRNMLDDLDLGVFSFEDTYIHPQNGQRYKEFRLPKTLTTTLVSGYSTKLRYRIVKRWEELEAKQPPQAPTFALPQSFSEALRLAAEQADQIEQQKQTMVLQAPKMEFLDKYVAADELTELNR